MAGKPKVIKARVISSNRGPYGAGSRPARSRPASQVGGSTQGGGCCPMVAALRSVKRGKFRLARRYAAMSLRLIAAR